MKLNEESRVSLFTWNWIEKRASSHAAGDPQGYSGKDSYRVQNRRSGIYSHKSMRAAVAQRGIKHRHGRTVLIKNVRAVLKNMVTSSFLRSSEMLKEFYVLAARVSIFKRIPHSSWNRHALTSKCVTWTCKFINVSLRYLLISNYYYDQKV